MANSGNGSFEVAQVVRSSTGNKYLLIYWEITVVEPLLDGMVLGLIAITLAGLFFAAYKQYKRGKQLGL